MQLNIPESTKPGLILIASMPDETFDSSMAILEGRTDATRSSLDASVGNAKTLTETAESLGVGRDMLELEDSVFFGQIASAIFDGLAEPRVAQDHFIARLRRLMSIPGLELRGKATSLWLENERYALSSRIITDVRPVFGDKVSESGPSAAVIVHHLRLDFIESGERRNFLIVLDDDDIESLRQACERAQKKQQSLMTFLERTGVKALKPFANAWDAPE